MKCAIHAVKAREARLSTTGCNVTKRKLLPAPRAFVERVDYASSGIDELKGKDTPHRRFIIDYPTVYIISLRDNKGSYRVYVGETNSIVQRTTQHLEGDTKESNSKRNLWIDLRDGAGTQMYVIGHSLFNKSLTLDIENRLMQYLPSNESVKSASETSVATENARTNAQGDYFTKEHLDRSFTQIWSKLHALDRQLFPAERIIRESALFKASPFHELTTEQSDAKFEIINAVVDQMQSIADSRLIMVSGAAGTGKTVLLSSVFYDLNQKLPAIEEHLGKSTLDAYMLVNHDEQVTVYQQVAEKLGISSTKNLKVMKPTSFINHRNPGEKADVVLIDEAHLLWTQGKQSYRGKNHLKDILERAHVVVAVFDPDQILAANQVWEPADLEWMEQRVDKSINLKLQMRMLASEDTIQWVRSFVDDGIIHKIPKDNKYSIKIFDDPNQLYESIKDKASNVEEGLSRLIATYDWQFSSARPPAENELWQVRVGDFSMPWNNQRKSTEKKTAGLQLSWAERPQTIDEIGSIFTIQGFDLNYAGVIIGPSVKYRDGKIIFDPSESWNPNVKNKRTLKDGSKQSFAEELLKNQLNVLLTRGVHGLHIYAVDRELREALTVAASGIGAD